MLPTDLMTEVTSQLRGERRDDSDRCETEYENSYPYQEVTQRNLLKPHLTLPLLPSLGNEVSML